MRVQCKPNLLPVMPKGACSAAAPKLPATRQQAGELLICSSTAPFAACGGRNRTATQTNHKGGRNRTAAQTNHMAAPAGASLNRHMCVR